MKLDKSCPSSTCTEGAILLGKVKSDGTVGFMETRLTLDAAAVQNFHEAGQPEHYFRFSQPCVQSGCNQWSGGNCGVIKKVLNEVGNDLPANAPNCLIRKTCRWFFQEGVQACYACSFIVADLSVPQEEPLFSTL